MIRTQTIQVFTALSAAATQTSQSFKVLGMPGLSIAATVAVATSPVGAIALQGSNDGTNYADITSVAIAANGTFLISLGSPVNYANVRAKYTYTSGTAGTLDATLCVVETL